MASFPHKRPILSRDEAETMAIDVLTFLAADETRLRRFIGVTGLEPSSIRSEASSTDFLIGVLDFLMNDESMLLVFAAHKNIDPGHISAARHALAPQDTSEA